MLIASLLAEAEVAPPLWLLVPFGLLLLAIALGPVAFPKVWHRRYAHIAVGLGVVSVAWYLFVARTPAPLWHAVEEYVGFMALIGSLFLVTSGIHLRVKGEATPLTNAGFLFLGAVVGNVMGTTGASMLLIRPWIQMNKVRAAPYHVVFFIFLVSNVGGGLTPIGDPPLFLGYLKGIPFWWVATHCWLGWLVAVLGLIGVFYVFDRQSFGRAPRRIREEIAAPDQWQFRGGHNLLWMGVIIVAVLRLPFGWREGGMAVAAAGSWLTTKREIHRANHFSLEPLQEVAWLFLGIFATMIPALAYLQIHGAELGLTSPMQFYWATGALSGVLDNAPTYLAFLATAMAGQGAHIDNREAVLGFAAAQPGLVEAISLASVFFGAMTYIGNGPNFMVRSIAMRAGVKTPSFGRYVTHYALPILLPVLAAVGVLFFSRWRILG